MDHKLRVLVRLDIDSRSAVLDVAGCLTGKSCTALFPIIRRAASLAGGLAVTVNLSTAEHINSGGLDLLHRFSRGGSVDPTTPHSFDGELAIIAPTALPRCAALAGAGFELASVA